MILARPSSIDHVYRLQCASCIVDGSGGIRIVVSDKTAKRHYGSRPYRHAIISTKHPGTGIFTTLCFSQRYLLAQKLHNACCQLAFCWDSLPLPISTQKTPASHSTTAKNGCLLSLPQCTDKGDQGERRRAPGSIFSLLAAYGRMDKRLIPPTQVQELG